MKYLLILLFYTVFLNNFVCAGEFDHSHASWSAILRSSVTISGHSSTVDYASLKRNPSALNQYLKTLETVSPQEYLEFNSNQKLAFLINSYNAFTIKLILDHYPLKSIKDIGGIFKSSWKIKFIKLLNEEISLDEIEHEKIRKNFKESRIHFALVCASRGCPALLNEAFVANKLDLQLENAAKNFLLDETRNRFDKDKKILELSSIFKWYGEDFDKYNGSINDFIASRITTDQEEQALIKAKSVKINFLDYNWFLNER